MVIFFFNISETIVTMRLQCVILYYKTKLFSFSAATKSVVETDVALYVALVAASILLAGMVLLFRLYKNKGRDHSMYNMANSGTYYFYYYRCAAENILL
jgi:hypothetical protein